MGPVYATRLTIIADSGHREGTLHDRTVDLCHRWMARVVAKYEVEMDEDVASDVRTVARQGLVTIVTEHLRIEDECAWRGVITHPYSPHGVENHSLQLRVEIVARDEGGEEVVTVRLLLGSLVDHIRPLDYRVKAPRIVLNLIEEFHEVSIGNVRATATARYLEDHETPDLVNDIVRSNRFAPIIVVSRTIEEELVCDPEAIAGEIIGLGRVYVLPSFAAATILSDGVGASLGCADGAVRLYWPGFGIGDRPHDHPHWLAERITRDTLQTRLAERIFDMLASASSLGITSDAKVWSLYRSASDARTREVIARAQQLAMTQVAATEQDYLDAVEQVYMLEDVNRSQAELLATQREEFAGRIYALEAEKESLQHQIRELKARATEASIDLVKAASEARSVSDVLRIIERLADPAYLVILKEAHESAADGHFNNNLEFAWRNLLLVYEAARIFHHDPSAKLLETMHRVGATDDQFKADTSDRSRQMYPAAYQKTYCPGGRAEAVAMRPHIKNGKGNAGNSLYVYWHVDTERRTFVIGHVGRKLKDSTGGY